MKSLVGKFSFTVPEDAKTSAGEAHPEAGQKQERAFNYNEVETDSEAHAVLTEKKLSLKDLVNEKLKGNARANAYQSAVLVYRPSEVSQEDIAERMTRDAIRLGMSEAQARQFVAAAIANKTE